MHCEDFPTRMHTKGQLRLPVATLSDEVSNASAHPNAIFVSVDFRFTGLGADLLGGLCSNGRGSGYGAFGLRQACTAQASAAAWKVLHLKRKKCGDAAARLAGPWPPS
jgi:hypothetical protein